MSLSFFCPQCQARLYEGVFNQPEMRPCRSCQTPLRIEVFPAFFRKITPGQSAEAVMVEGESSCFFHPQKKAVTPCAGCGRFLCALCDCEFHGQHFCPACLEAGKTKGKIKALDNERTRYDYIALQLAFLPILIFYFTLITAPVALFIAIRHWKTSCSLVQRSRPRFLVAIVVSALQIAGWTVLIILLLTIKHHAAHG